MKRIGFVLMFIVLCFCGCLQEVPDTEISRGILDRVEYKTSSFNSPDYTIIYYEDGRTQVLNGMKSVGFGHGESIKVVNGYNGQRVIKNDTTNNNDKL